MPTTEMQQIDIFCRVIDNFGDIAICWRLARQLIEKKQRVRLWVDNLSVFAQLYPSINPHTAQQNLEHGLIVSAWQASPAPCFANIIPDIVIAAFACDLPASYLAAMAALPRPPLYCNFEYLSAESWVEDCHLLPSIDPRTGLKQYFYFMGFTAKTGGLLRETDLLQTQMGFLQDTAAQTAFWERCQIQPTLLSNRLTISLFSYHLAHLHHFLHCCAHGNRPISLLLTQCAAHLSVAAFFQVASLEIGSIYSQGQLQVHILPFLSHPDFDALLWLCDVNCVRGEDSLVRAIWADKPFLWQLYPQAEDYHWIKAQAFLAQQRPFFSPILHGKIHAIMQTWNTEAPYTLSEWNDLIQEYPAWQQQNRAWRSHLLTQNDCVSQFLAWANTQTLA